MLLSPLSSLNSEFKSYIITILISDYSRNIVGIIRDSESESQDSPFCARHTAYILALKAHKCREQRQGCRIPRLKKKIARSVAP